VARAVERAAAVRAVDGAEVVRGAAALRLADDGAAGFRPAPFAVVPFAAAPFAVVPFAAVARAAVLCAAAPFAADPLVVELLVVEPLVVEPDGFFGAALPLAPLAVGAAPLAFFAPVAPEPARGVDDERAPGSRAEPEGRAGRREEGMGRLCRFAGPLYGHYFGAPCVETRKSAPAQRFGPKP
jgi:hypothetical protein